ncbi:MAG: CRISPR-associated protein [Muribaculaceae bacterium]|nr:CRISPR-associated protein [Muribaculaceae bacterium]
MNIKYKVEFFTDWHCGSGLAAGADVDALVVKDPQGLPYIPGKTVKGLIREAAEDIIRFRSGKDKELDVARHRLAIEAFGYFDGKSETDGQRPEMTRGRAYFTNASLPEDEQAAIVADSLQPYLFRTISSTAIDKNGIAVDHSLRRTEVTVPCTLEGEILNLPDNEDFKKIITDAMRYVKRLGQNRNRGLGRCAFTVAGTANNKKS